MIIPMVILGLLALGVLGYLIYRYIVKSPVLDSVLDNVDAPSVAVKNAKNAINTVDVAARKTAEEIEKLQKDAAKASEFLGQTKPSESADPAVESDEDK